MESLQSQDDLTIYEVDETYLKDKLSHLHPMPFPLSSVVELSTKIIGSGGQAEIRLGYLLEDHLRKNMNNTTDIANANNNHNFVGVGSGSVAVSGSGAAGAVAGSSGSGVAAGAVGSGIHSSLGSVGSGVNGHVMKPVALKYFKKKYLLSDKSNIDRLVNEIHALSTAYHPNIIGFYGFFIESNHVVLLMEYARRGDLFGLITTKTFTEEQIATMFLDMIRSVEYLHLRGFVHRDVKLENFLVDENYSIKLADFGFCKNRTSGLHTPCGSITYASPEILENKEYNSSTDIWSLGISLYAMLTKTSPWNDENIRETRERIINGHMAKLPNTVSEIARDLIYKMCVVDPSRRISAHDALFHHFVYQFKLMPAKILPLNKRYSISVKTESLPTKLPQPGSLTSTAAEGISPPDSPKSMSPRFHSNRRPISEIKNKNMSLSGRRLSAIAMKTLTFDDASAPTASRGFAPGPQPTF